MTRVPELTRLARAVAGDPGTALVQVLRLLCEQLGAETAQLGRVEGAAHHVDLAVVLARGRVAALEGAWPAAESWAARVPQGVPLLVSAVAEVPHLAGLAFARRLAVGSYGAVRLQGRGGADAGVLEVVGPPRPLGERDAAVLEGLAEVVGELAGPFRAGGGAPVPAQPDLASVAGAVSRAADVAELTRPLLDALHELTGLASTYLTVVHEDAGHQEIRYSRNAREEGFAIPEGLRVPWEDTLCKRALDEGRRCTTDVPAVWGDSDAAAALGIVTYVSVPVRLSDGSLWGTLCGADDRALEQARDHLPTLGLFSRLIAAEVERTGR